MSESFDLDLKPEPGSPERDALTKVSIPMVEYRLLAGSYKENAALAARVRELEAALEMIDDEVCVVLKGDVCAFVSDTFAYATADAEPIPWTEMLAVHALWKQHGWYGVVAWVEKKRGIEALSAVEKDGKLAAARAALAPTQRDT